MSNVLSNEVIQMKKYLMKKSLSVYTRRCGRCDKLYISCARTGSVCKDCNRSRGCGALTGGLEGKEVRIKLNEIIIERRKATLKKRFLLTTKA